MKKLFSILAIAMIVCMGVTLTSCQKKSKDATEVVYSKDSIASHVDSTNHP